MWGWRGKSRKRVIKWTRAESEGGGDGQLAVGAELGRGLHSLAFLVFFCLFLVFLGLGLAFSVLAASWPRAAGWGLVGGCSGWELAEGAGCKPARGAAS